MVDASPAAPGTNTDAFLYGVRRASTSVFAFVIITTCIGFGALCHDYGVSVGSAMLFTATFLFVRRSAFAGVVVGEAVLIAGALVFGD